MARSTNRTAVAVNQPDLAMLGTTNKAQGDDATSPFVMACWFCSELITVLVR